MWPVRHCSIKPAWQPGNVVGGSLVCTLGYGSVGRWTGTQTTLGSTNLTCLEVRWLTTPNKVVPCTTELQFLASLWGYYLSDYPVVMIFCDVMHCRIAPEFKNKLLASIQVLHIVEKINNHMLKVKIYSLLDTNFYYVACCALWVLCLRAGADILIKRPVSDHLHWLRAAAR